MTGVNNHLYKNKTYQSATTDKLLITQKSKTEIIFKECIINNDNINKFRITDLTFTHGSADYNSNTITIYRYKIDPCLNLPKDDPLYTAIEKLQKLEPTTIKHESKHLENYKLGNPFLIAKNYYEISGLYAFNEISAHATAHLVCPTQSFNELCYAVSHGIDDLLACKNIYIQLHMIQVQRYLLFALAKSTNYETIKHHIEHDLPHYSDTFHQTINGYLTYDNKYFFDKDHDIPQELKQKLFSLRTKYETMTYKTLLTTFEKYVKTHQA